MGLYGDKKDYEEMVKENMIKARLLYNLPAEKQKQILELLDKKEKIMSQNGFWANLKLNHINKKIEKIQKNEIKGRS